MRVILAFNRIGRTNETFWKVFSQLYEDFEKTYTFDERLKLLNCFSDHMPSMSVHLYKSFELDYLPKPEVNLKQIKITYTYDQQLCLLKILGAYQGFRTSQVLRDLHDLLQVFALQKLKRGDYFSSEDNLIELARAVSRNGSNEQLKGEVKRRFRERIDTYEEGESERHKLQIKYNQIYYK